MLRTRKGNRRHQEIHCSRRRGAKGSLVGKGTCRLVMDGLTRRDPSVGHAWGNLRNGPGFAGMGGGALLCPESRPERPPLPPAGPAQRVPDVPPCDLQLMAMEESSRFTNRPDQPPSKTDHAPPAVCCM